MSEKSNPSIDNIELKEISKKTKILPIWALILIAVINISAIFHLLKTRSQDEVIKYSFYIGMFFLAGIVMTILVSWFVNRFREIDKMDLALLVFSPVLSAFAGFIYYSFGVSIKDLLIWIQSESNTESATVILAILITFLLGIGLFYFRLKLRGLYGILEIFTGLAVAVDRVTAENNISNENSDFYLAFLTAAVYLVVRGLDNIHQGLTKEPLDPIMSRFIKRFKKSN